MHLYDTGNTRRRGVRALHVSYDIGEPDPGLVQDWDQTTLEVIGAFLISSPAKNDAWNSGKNYVIQWDTLGSAQNVIIEYSIDHGGSWILIDQIPNSGSYDWTVPEHTSANCQVKITDVVDTKMTKTSDLFN